MFWLTAMPYPNTLVAIKANKNANRFEIFYQRYPVGLRTGRQPCGYKPINLADQDNEDGVIKAPKN